MITQYTSFQQQRNVYDAADDALLEGGTSLAKVVQIVRSHEIYTITPEHCDTMKAIFPEILEAVKTCITILNDADLVPDLRPYNVIRNLSILHCSVISAQQLVKNVSGQCHSARLEKDPTGSYWHLRTCLRNIVRVYQSLHHQLKQEETSWQCVSATA